jgi:hypothetical protein
MPGLVPGIHVLAAFAGRKTWMAGTSPAMTTKTQKPADSLFRRHEIRLFFARAADKFGIDRAARCLPL